MFHTCRVVRPGFWAGVFLVSVGSLAPSDAVAQCFDDGCSGTWTGGRVAYILSGGPNATDPLASDDQMNVCVNGQRVYCDADIFAGGNGAVSFTADPGDEIRITSYDYFGNCRSRSALWLHSGSGCRVKLADARDDGCGGYPPRLLFDTVTAALPDWATLDEDEDGKPDCCQPPALRETSLEKLINGPAHHTDAYPLDQYMVLRRGATFKVGLALDRDDFEDCATVAFEAIDKLDSASVASIPVLENEGAAATWHARLESKSDGPGGVKLFLYRINIPPTAAIGEYDLSVLFSDEGAVLAREAFSRPLVILFNPWNEADPVYLAEDAKRSEYVLGRNGYIWQEANPTPWRYDPFGENSLRSLLHLLEISGLTHAQRKDPIAVSRMLSQLVNFDDGDGGILVGNWGKNYTGGTDPNFWSGSDEILARYVAGGYAPVKFGQCWVFAGVLTSMLRCAGLPARSVTNINSGHDQPDSPSEAIDFVFTRDESRLTMVDRGCFENDLNKPGYRKDRCISDSIWNFHVWCEAWMTRADVPAADGWQALDATPQEPSAGAYRLGPAATRSVFKKTGGNYDVAFVMAEVDADVQFWVYTAAGDGTRHPPTKSGPPYPHAVGTQVVTKAVGADLAADVTGLYKTPEPKPAGSKRRFQDSNPLVELDAPPFVAPGGDAVFRLTLRAADATVRPVYGSITVAAISYNGDILGQIGGVERTFELQGGGEEIIELVIPAADYQPFLATTHTLEVVAGAENVEPDEPVTIVTARTRLAGGELTLTLDPPGEIPPDGAVTATVRFTNRLTVDLTNCAIRLYAGDNAVVMDGAATVNFDVGTLAAGASVERTQKITAPGGGTYGLAAALGSEELSARSRTTYVTFAAKDDSDADADNDDGSDDSVGDTPPGCGADGGCGAGMPVTMALTMIGLVATKRRHRDPRADGRRKV